MGFYDEMTGIVDAIRNSDQRIYQVTFVLNGNKVDVWKRVHRINDNPALVAFRIGCLEGVTTQQLGDFIYELSHKFPYLATYRVLPVVGREEPGLALIHARNWY